jgi:hypothetical protein
MRQLDSVLHSLSSERSRSDIALANVNGWGPVPVPHTDTAQLRRASTADLAATSVGVLASILLAAVVGVGFFLAFAKMISSDIAGFYGMTILVPTVSILAGTTLIVGLRGAMINTHFLAAPFALLAVYVLTWFGRIWMTHGIVEATSLVHSPVDFIALIRGSIEADVPFLASIGPNWIPIFIGVRLLLVMFACLALTRLIFGKEN